MSITAAAERIGAIQTLIQDLAAPARARATTTGAAGSTPAPASATGFSDALDRALRASVPAPGGAAPPADGAGGGRAIVEQAKQYLGVPYVFGGEDRTGMDCSGLVQRVLADLGIDAPRVVQDQADIGVEVPSLDQAQPGDLLVTRGEGHILIYAGDGKVIHAPRPGKDVQLVDNYLSPGEISTIRRVVPAAAGTAPQASSAPSDAATIAPAQLLSVMQSTFAARSGASSPAALLSETRA